jgi:YidC/Oxa1 family membrane protein insertase
VEKNTLLAIVLSILVMVGFSVMQGVFFPRQPAPAQNAQSGESAPSEVPFNAAQPAVPAAVPQPATAQPQVNAPPAGNAPAGSAQSADGGPAVEQYALIETGLFIVKLSNAGGDIVSWKIKERKNNNKTGGEELLEMVLSGDREAHAFSIAFGGFDAQPVSSLFYMNRLSEYQVEFYRDFVIPQGGAAPDGAPQSFRLIKRYEFKPHDYMFKLTITLDGGYTTPGFNFAPQQAGGIAYTLAFGPQIGPRFAKLDNRYDYRQYFTYINGKRKTARSNDLITSRPAWAAICGKYFALIAIPYIPQYDISFSDRPEAGLPSASRLAIVRPAVNTSKTEDPYHFYLGPKNQDVLNAYNTGVNDFGIKDMQLVEVSNSRGILSPLEKALKWLLLLFYKIVRNYGVAIILLTLLVKVIFFPLTKKGSEATMRMQTLAPKIKELQEKYKDNPQKLNLEMAEFYKKEGYNPLSGCLPMLLQIPIFFAMYNLFNNHFDLRGAMFIPGWIPDLSLPESIWTFPDGFRLPLLGWTALRLLPFIYVGSQLLYGKVTQTPDQQSNTQMKLMLYVMPIVFFFILYDVPSGLLIYWIFSNVLTMVQQVAINKYIAQKKAAQALNPEPVIAPKKKKKR